MTKTIITPSSTTPTTSADQTANQSVAIVVAVVALGLAGAGGWEAYGALAAQGGRAALAEAKALPRGADKDNALHRAQRDLTAAVDVSAADPMLWLALAETRYLQAVAAAAEGVSPELAEAAGHAASRAAQLAPQDPTASAVLAQALAAAGQHPAAIAQPLTASYALDADNQSLAAWRPAVAFQAWPALPAPTREAALLEACFYGRETPQRFAALQQAAASAADPDLAARLTALLTDAACQPAPVRFGDQPPQG